MASDYTYQVARIRALEVGLLSETELEGFIAMKDSSEVLRALTEHGWGEPGDESAEGVLGSEESKLWDTVRDLHIDMENFDVLLFQKRFHNLKAAIKELASPGHHGDIYYDDDTGVLADVKRGEFGALDSDVRKACEEAYQVLTRTGDGQLCDVILDKACLDAIHEAGVKAKKRGETVIYDYAESIVATSDIKIAVRALATGKQKEFLERALSECDAISKSQLIKACAQDSDQLKEYLNEAGYGEAADLMDDPSGFDRWARDRVLNDLSGQKYETFTIGPVISYILSRQDEIRKARIIISGKDNGLTDDQIRARVRSLNA